MIADLEPGEGAGRRRRDRRHRRRDRRRGDVTDEAAVQAAIDATRARVRWARPGRQQRRAVAVQVAAGDHRGRLGPAARRDGQGLVPGVEGRGEGADRAGARRRHHLHLVEELGLRRARTTSPTPRPRPTRPTRCGCWPPSSASTASRSTASTPTASSAAPGIFAGGWGANRAAVYGVEEEDLGAFYAQRTILKREVLPENVANAVFALCGPDLSHTTGLHIPVDAGVAAAFLR